MQLLFSLISLLLALLKFDSEFQFFNFVKLESSSLDEIIESANSSTGAGSNSRLLFSY